MPFCSRFADRLNAYWLSQPPSCFGSWALGLGLPCRPTSNLNLVQIYKSPWGHQRAVVGDELAPRIHHTASETVNFGSERHDVRV